MKALITILTLTALPVVAFAHGTSIDATRDATVAAIEQFKLDEEHAVHIFTGVRAAPSGAKIKVQITVNTSAKKVDYTCSMDHSDPQNEKMVCAK